MNLAFARVLDASAILAFLHSEPGGDVVEPLLAGSAMSAVNWSEVLRVIHAQGVDTTGLLEDLIALRLAIIPFGARQADTTVALWLPTRAKGLSLGDRACIGLALLAGAPAITADRAWKDLQVGVTIQVIR